jgi:hypothetical protein
LEEALVDVDWSEADPAEDGAAEVDAADDAVT